MPVSYTPSQERERYKQMVQKQNDDVGDCLYNGGQNCYVTHENGDRDYYKEDKKGNYYISKQITYATKKETMWEKVGQPAMEFTMMLPMGGVEGLLGIAGRSGSKEVAMAITRSLSFNGSKGLGITGERALFQVMRKEGMDLGMTVAESESYAKGISSLITNEGTMSMRQTQFAFKFARRYPKTVSILQNIQSSKIYTGVKDKALYLKSLRDSYKNLITEIEDFGC
jgi:hypothetical protein